MPSPGSVLVPPAFPPSSRQRDGAQSVMCAASRCRGATSQQVMELEEWERRNCNRRNRVDMLMVASEAEASPSGHSAPSRQQRAMRTRLQQLLNPSTDSDISSSQLRTSYSSAFSPSSEGRSVHRRLLPVPRTNAQLSTTTTTSSVGQSSRASGASSPFSWHYVDSRPLESTTRAASVAALRHRGGGAPNASALDSSPPRYRVCSPTVRDHRNAPVLEVVHPHARDPCLPPVRFF
eukprot:PhM_4_TR7983/c0_g1_i1/m.86986